MLHYFRLKHTALPDFRLKVSGTGAFLRGQILQIFTFYAHLLKNYTTSKQARTLCEIGFYGI
jgi:hypothetical protein